MIDFSTLKSLEIPEGNVTQIADASGNVLWKQAPSGATITINGEGGDYASVVIDGVTYNTATVIVVPIGTVVSCVTNSDTDYKTVVRANYETVAKAEGATYDYTVVGDATITLSTPKYNVAVPQLYGLIDIVDVNAPNGAIVSITASGVTTGYSSGSGVTIDGVSYCSPVSLGVPMGAVIVCSAVGKYVSPYGQFGGTILLNGTTVASYVSGVSPTIYEYTVTKDVTVNISGIGSPSGVFQSIYITEL